MKLTQSHPFTLLALIPAALLAFSCGFHAHAQNAGAGAPVAGAVEADVAQATFTVSAIDASKRTVTLQSATGSTRSVKCGKAVVNFDQIKVGDKVNVAIVESVAVVVRTKGAPPSAGGRPPR